MSLESWKLEYRPLCKELSSKNAVKQDLHEFAGFVPVNLERHGLLEAPDVPLTRHLCHRGGMAPPEACNGCLVAKSQGGPCSPDTIDNHQSLMRKLIVVRNINRANRALGLAKSAAKRHYMVSVNKSDKKYAKIVDGLCAEAADLNAGIFTSNAGVQYEPGKLES